MIEYIIIPTLGRVHKQITYNNLPPFLQERTYFTVQTHEYDAMKELYGDKALQLPSEIKGIGSTRKWIFERFKDHRFAMIDDDFKFQVKEPTPDPNENDGKMWRSTWFTEEHFHEVFDLMNTWMDEGIHVCGLLPSIIIPDIKQWPYRENQRIMGSWFLDGPNIPRDLQWDRASFGEDLDVALQLATRGFRNRTSSKYMTYVTPTQTAGGCSLERTLEKHNESQRKLAEMWPDFVSIKEKVVPGGPWAGQIKLNVTIQMKKAYASSQVKETSNSGLADFFA